MSNNIRGLLLESSSPHCVLFSFFFCVDSMHPNMHRVGANGPCSEVITCTCYW